MFQKFLLLFIFCSCSLWCSDIAVLTVSSRGPNDAALKNKQVYCAQHGYALLSTDNIKEKLLIIKKAFNEQKYKWILWMNEDCLIMNFDVPIEDMIDEKYKLIVTRDGPRICSDVFLAKRNTGINYLLRSPHFPGALKKRICKIVPQRIFNSYPSEYFFMNGQRGELQNEYQMGDFILNLMGCKTGLERYASLAANDRKLITLEHYLGYYGFQLSPAPSEKNEGYISDAQKAQFIERLNAYPNIKKIAEIGLNAGHSAENFFSCCNRLEKFVSFDLSEYAYTQVAVDYFFRNYKERFEFVRGDSQKTVPSYFHHFPEQTFDLIYIDGGHFYTNCINDIKNCKKLAHPNTILWIDDFFEGGETQRAILECESEGIIQIVGVNEATDHARIRRWVEAIYQ
jgi:predicted O-methyltransferase YrrM